MQPWDTDDHTEQCDGAWPRGVKAWPDRGMDLSMAEAFPCCLELIFLPVPAFATTHAGDFAS